MTAVISPCQQYRYFLQRPVGAPLDGSVVGPTCLFIMLNPSTADAHVDDPTIRRCKDFARRLQCNWLQVVNLFAYRATDPAVLARMSRLRAIGPDNDRYLISAAMMARYIICAWGNHGKLFGRDAEVISMLRQLRTAPVLQALRVNKNGTPAHPLYLPANAQLRPL